jgi:hypothetical protein
MPKPISHKPKPAPRPTIDRHKLPTWVVEEERRVQTRCFRCHGLKPFGGSWYCPKCRPIVRAATEKQAARYQGRPY